MTNEITRPLPRTWWLRRPNYLLFMIRELTSVVVFAYSVLLIWILFAASNDGSFSALYEALQGRVSVLIHVALLIVAMFHTSTWIALTPKVMVLWRDDERVDPDLIAGVNAILFLAVSGVVLWLVLG